MAQNKDGTIDELGVYVVVIIMKKNNRTHSTLSKENIDLIHSTVL